MIKADMVTKKFDHFVALNNITCTIPEGSIYGMVGSNGAGKSTLLRLIAGVYKPNKGMIKIDDENVYKSNNAKEKISYVPDDLFFLSGSTMEGMAKFKKSFYPKFDMQRFYYLANAFNLDYKKPIFGFSKGMKRQAAIVLALSCPAKYYLFDETFDGLDPVVRNLVKSLICKEVYENNATAIVTSHSLRELEDTCDQLSLLHKGGIVFESDIQNLKTSLFKVQIAFSDNYTVEKFPQLDILHFSKMGSVSNIIIRGNKDETVNYLNSMNPVLLDVLPLSLEEVFTYETESLGYTFENVLEAE